MTSLEQLLKSREGDKGKPVLRVYRDTVYHLLTVGWGHRVNDDDHLNLGDTIDAAQADKLFQRDTAAALSAARSQAAQAGIRSGIRNDDTIAALASVIAELGKDWNTSSPELRQAWQSIKDKKYQDAQDAVARSSWARQSPAKGRDFQQALANLTLDTVHQQASSTANAHSALKDQAAKLGVKDDRLIDQIKTLLSDVDAAQQKLIMACCEKTLALIASGQHQAAEGELARA